MYLQPVYRTPKEEKALRAEEAKRDTQNRENWRDYVYAKNMIPGMQQVNNALASKLRAALGPVSNKPVIDMQAIKARRAARHQARFGN